MTGIRCCNRWVPYQYHTDLYGFPLARSEEVKRYHHQLLDSHQNPRYHHFQSKSSTTVIWKSTHRHGVQRVAGCCEGNTYADAEWTRELCAERSNQFDSVVRIGERPVITAQGIDFAALSAESENPYLSRVKRLLGCFNKVAPREPHLVLDWRWGFFIHPSLEEVVS